MAKILLVDDDDDILEATAPLLRAEGHQVETLSRASQIVPTLIRVKPNVLLQDCAMPGLNVAQLVTDLRAKPQFKGISVILFTGAADVSGIAKTLEADGFLEKPFSGPALAQKILDVTGEKPPAAKPSKGRRDKG